MVRHGRHLGRHHDLVLERRPAAAHVPRVLASVIILVGWQDQRVAGRQHRDADPEEPLNAGPINRGGQRHPPPDQLVVLLPIYKL